MSFSFFRITFIILFVLIGSHKGLAQKPDTTVLHQGRYITGLNGSISGQNVFGSNSSGQNQKINEYTIGTQSGYFIRNKWVLGGDFNLTKSATNSNEFNYSSESLRLGVWSRYYLITYDKGALFADLTPFYTVVNQITEINVPNFQSSEELKGSGFGLEPSFGFAYLINRNVGFGMSTSYQFGQVYATKQNYILNQETEDSYNFSRLIFRFSFQIYLDQFFF